MLVSSKRLRPLRPYLAVRWPRQQSALCDLGRGAVRNADLRRRAVLHRRSDDLNDLDWFAAIELHFLGICQAQ